MRVSKIICSCWLNVVKWYWEKWEYLKLCVSCRLNVVKWYWDNDMCMVGIKDLKLWILHVLVLWNHEIALLNYARHSEDIIHMSYDSYKLLVEAF